MSRFPGAILLGEVATPATPPPAGSRWVYAKTDGKVYQLNSSGGESEVGAGPVAKRVTAQISSTATTYADITALAFTLAPNTSYTVDWYLFFTAAAATTGLGLQLGGTAAIASLRGRIEVPLTAATFTSAIVTALNSGVLGTGSAGTTPLMATIHAALTTGAASGTLLPRYATEVAASAVTVLPQSYGILTPAP